MGVCVGGGGGHNPALACGVDSSNVESLGTNVSTTRGTNVSTTRRNKRKYRDSKGTRMEGAKHGDGQSDAFGARAECCLSSE